MLFATVRVAFVSFALLVAAAVSAEAQFGIPLGRSDPKQDSETARDLVARYCRMDYAGARLSPSEWPKVQPLVSWRTNPEYPLMMVTLRFDVDPEPIPEHGKFLITVHYRLLGRYDMAEGYSQRATNSVQDVQFVVSEVNGDWRITDAEPNYPHPSRAAVLQWLNQKLADVQDPATKLTYQHAVEDLQAQKSSPLAK